MTLKGWLLGIFAVAIILETVLIILPEGKTGKYIKGFFLLVLALVILRPIVDFKNNFKDFDINVSTNNSNDFTQQNDYLEYVVNVSVEEKIRQCKILLENCGIKESDVEIAYTRTQGIEYIITKVNLNLTNAVIIGQDEHKNIIEKAKNNLCEYLNVSDGVIIIYE